MRKFKYVEPGDNNEPIEFVYTEEEILWEYWFHWQAAMKKAGKDHLINIQNCVDDWVVVHWAEEII